MRELEVMEKSPQCQTQTEWKTDQLFLSSYNSFNEARLTKDKAHLRHQVKERSDTARPSARQEHRLTQHLASSETKDVGQDLEHRLVGSHGSHIVLDGEEEREDEEESEAGRCQSPLIRSA